ncbi:MAG: NUDIX hydrolase [Clostridiales bacterium]|nr:NUDIX hydrolase [Clostridiales bacterium]
MKQVPVLNSMEKTRDTKFLKNYTLNYTNTEGKEKIYETVSNFDYDRPEQLGESVAGVIIVGWKKDKMLLCREFRMGVNHFVYNFPAGHIDEGEDVEHCAARELYEETGLNIVKVYKVLPPSYASPDLSDSTAWLLFAEVEGELSDHTEADEWIQPGFYSKEELGQMLLTERFSGRAQMAACFYSISGSAGFPGD